MKGNRKMSRKEYAFQQRMQKIFDKLGYVTVNCAQGKLFDLILLKNGRVYLVELKAKDTRYPESQKQLQINLARRAGQNFVLIRQSKEKGKVEVECLNYKLVFDILVLESDIKSVGILKGKVKMEGVD